LKPADQLPPRTRLYLPLIFSSDFRLLAGITKARH
jgi:hypothetical protein